MDGNTKPLNEFKWLHYAVLIGLIFFVVFLKLGSFHIRWWDESMFAVNTFEMMENGHYFSLYYDGAPDLYNTKPPLTSWFQLISIKLFGYNEYAIRFPSAMAAALSILAIFRFSKRHLSLHWAWISALILLTADGFVAYHTARTGDADALLTLFMLLSVLAFIDFLITQHKHQILLVFIFISLGFATKLYAVFLFVPAFLVALIYMKKLRQFIFNWYFLIGLVFFLGSAILLIVMREIQTPGYIDLILSKDAGRIFEVVEYHTASISYYFDNLFSYRFGMWMIFAVIGAALLFISTNEKQRIIHLVLFACIISYLLVITVSVTKLEWYDMPLFPLLALLAAYPIQLLILEKLGVAWQQYAFIALIFVYPYYIAFYESQGNTIALGDSQIEVKENYLYTAFRNQRDMNGVKVFYHCWDGGLLFYQYKFKTIDQQFDLIYNLEDLKAGDRVLVSNDSLKNLLHTNFIVDPIENIESAELVQLLSK